MPILAEDSQIFLNATQIAQTQPEEAYKMLRQLESRNPMDGNLIAWLVFTAPTYPEKQQWAQRARLTLPNDPTAQQAVSWFDSLPIPPGIATAAPATASQTSIADGAAIFGERNRDFIEGRSNKIYATQPLYELVVAVIMAVGCLTVFGFFLNEFLTEKKVYESGTTATGLVTSKSSSSGAGRRNSANYYIDYTFSARNPATGQMQTYSRHEDVQISVYNSFRRGDSVPIRFLPQSPQDARIMGEGINGWKWLIILGFFGGFGLVCIGGAVGYALERKKWNELERDSQRIVAGLKEVQEKRAGYFYKYYEFKYGFVSPQTGKYIEKKVTLSGGKAKHLVDGNTFEMNKPVFVLYKSDRKFVAL
jgi:hypothetical protein